MSTTSEAPTTRGPHLVSTEKAIDAITVENRIRKDLGDLSELKVSLGRLGMLNPITLGPVNDVLLAGQRRIEAARQLGWTHVPVRVAVTVADLRDALLIERDENSCRLPLAPSEAARMTKMIVELERPRAERTSRRNLKQGTESPSGKVGHSGDEESPGRVRDIAAEVTGLSRETLRKAEAVVDATESDDPRVAEVARDAEAEMDATGKVDPAHRKVAEALDEAERRAASRRLDHVTLELLADIEPEERERLLTERAELDDLLGIIRCPGCGETWTLATPKARGPRWYQNDPNGVCERCQPQVSGAEDDATREGASPAHDGRGSEPLESSAPERPPETIDLTPAVSQLTVFAGHLVELDVTMLDPDAAREWVEQLRDVVDRINSFIENVELCL